MVSDPLNIREALSNHLDSCSAIIPVSELRRIRYCRNTWDWEVSQSEINTAHFAEFRVGSYYLNCLPALFSLPNIGKVNNF